MGLWILEYQFVLDEYVLWLVAGAMFIYLLSQAYYLEGAEVAALAFAAVIFAMAMKRESMFH